MNRTWALTIGVIAALGVAFFSGAFVSSSGAKPVDEKKSDDVKPAVVVGQKTAVFNMAAVTRDFNQAKYQVWLLNNKKTELSKQLIAWRSEYIEIQSELRKNPNHPDKNGMEKKMQDLTRKIEDEDRKINKDLNDAAGVIVSDLYDKMKEVVDKTAEQNGFQIVLAYPDAVTPEEKNNAYIKELKLKPPAAQPFYVAPDVDITARVIKTLNEKYPPIDPETKKPVDVSKLPLPAPVPASDNSPMKIQFPPGMIPMDSGGSRPTP
jgi:Skp family chaperone for outer membrane proteins